MEFLLLHSIVHYIVIQCCSAYSTQFRLYLPYGFASMTGFILLFGGHARIGCIIVFVVVVVAFNVVCGWYKYGIPSKATPSRYWFDNGSVGNSSKEYWIGMRCWTKRKGATASMIHTVVDNLGLGKTNVVQVAHQFVGHDT